MSISFVKVGLAATALALASTAQADAAGTFTGSTSGTFGTPSGSTSAVFSGVGTNVFTTGEAFSDSVANILEFRGNSFSTAANSPFSLGALNYTNGVTFIGSNVDSVPLMVTLDFTSPLGISQTFEFVFDFLVTPNTSTDPAENADRLIAQTSVPAQTFVFDGKTFTLELLGFTQDGSGAINNQFFAFEDATTGGTLLGQIIEAPTEQDVPEPFSLLGLGLVGAVVAIRQRQS